MDPHRFSGNVYVEATHPNQGVNLAWTQSSEYLLAHGDAYAPTLSK